MTNSNLSKYLKYAIWALLGLIVLIPIYVDSDFFFPYIYSKGIAFKVLVEILFIFWLAYIWSDKNKKIKIDWLTIIFFVMIVFMFISSIFGVEFYRSFWSIMERSEGILLWLHMFIFFVVLRNMFGESDKKLIFLDIFLIAAQVVAVIGFFQFIGVEFINKTGVADGRLQATIGNAAYLAGYMLFAFFFAAYLFIKRQNVWLKSYYAVTAILDLFIMFNTGTRGAFLAFLISVFLFVVYNIFRSSNKKLKLSFLVLTVLFLGSVFFVYQNKDSAWVQNNSIIRRMTSISLSERTAQTRLMAWESAFKGFKEKPILGYGSDNYYVVFNKYFNPDIYSHEGSRVWFDRAHNIFLDHLINGGIIELALYISLLGFPAWILFRRGIFKKSNEGLSANWDKQVLFLSVVAFVAQGMVVFESMVTYIPLFIILALITNRYSKPLKEWNNTKVVLGVAILYLIALGPIMYFVNIREAKANLKLIEALRYGEVDIQTSFDGYVEAIEMGSSGSNEFYRRITEFVDGLIVNRLIQPYQAMTYTEKVDSYLQERAETHPYDVANLILYMRHLNYTYPLDQNRLYKVRDLAETALEYSPTRPHIYYEIGYADLYIYQWKRDAGETDLLQEYQNKVVDSFRKAIDLNPKVKESYLNMIMALLATDQADKVGGYLTDMDALSIDYTDEDNLLRMANSAVSAQYYDWSAYFFNLLVENYPQNPDYYTSLALSYAYNGQNDLAIEMAEEVRRFGDTYSVQADQFIQKVKEGVFRK